MCLQVFKTIHIQSNKVQLMQLSHLIGRVNVDAILDVIQSLVQVARTGRS